MGRPGRVSGPVRQARRYLATTIGVAAVAVGVCAGIDARMVFTNVPEWWQPLALIGALIVAERCELRMPFRSHRPSSGLADAVLAIGLFWLPPGCVVVCTAAGLGISQAFARVDRLRRAFNVAACSIAAAAAVLVGVAGMTGVPGQHFPRTTIARDVMPEASTRWYLVVLLAMAVYFLVSHTLASHAESLLTGVRMRRAWRHGAPLAVAHWGANTVYGLLAAVLASREPGLLPALAAPVVISALADQAWSRSLALRQRLQLLYRAGRILARRLGDPRAWRVFVRQVARALDCDGAVIFLGRPDDRVLEVIANNGVYQQLIVRPDAAAWERSALAFADRAGWTRLTLVPLESDRRVLGYLGVFDPRERSGLESHERGLLFTLANQATTALRNEQLFHDSESERATLRDIVSHSSDGIYTVGPDRAVRSWNPAMAAMTGWSSSEAIGRPCHELLRARDGDGADLCAGSCPILTAATSRQGVVADAHVSVRDETTRWIRYSHAPIISSTGEMETDVVVVRDVTRDRRSEEAKADFVANISHELRTPLTPIKGFLLTLLREDRWFDEQRRREYYELMLGQAERLESLIEDLLDVTRVEDGVGGDEVRPIDAARLAGQVVDRVRPTAPGRRILLTTPDAPVTVQGSRRRVDQVLGNLLSNAVRYTPEPEPVEVRVTAGNGEVVFEVRDTGPGIPADEQDRIFERFHRGGAYLTRETGGAGLGLYLAKRLVEAMGGRIWVDSRVGHGSTFAFALPAAPVLPPQPDIAAHR